MPLLTKALWAETPAPRAAPRALLRDWAASEGITEEARRSWGPERSGVSVVVGSSPCEQAGGEGRQALGLAVFIPGRPPRGPGSGVRGWLSPVRLVLCSGPSGLTPVLAELRSQLRGQLCCPGPGAGGLPGPG